MPDSAYTTVDSVAATDTTYNGKSHVTIMNSRNLKTGLTTSSYLNYEDNGDISEYAGGSFLAILGISYPNWITFPLQSHSTTGFKITDTTITLVVPIHVIAVDSMLYVNIGTFAVNEKTLGIFNMKHNDYYSGSVTIITGFPGIPFSTTQNIAMSFAPSIGYYTERTNQPFIIPLGIAPSVNGLNKKLVSYQLK